MPITIGVDIGGSHISSAAINKETNAIIGGTYFQGSVNNKASKEIILKEWAKVINLTLMAINGEEADGIGFAMPGPFQYKNGIAMFQRNDKYEALYEVSVASELAMYLNQPELNMRFLNDAASFGVGASINSLYNKEQKVVAITLGTGFGAAFLQGNLPVISGKNIPQGGRLWDQPFLTGIADDYFSTRWFLLKYKEITGNKLITGVKDVVNHDKEIASELFLEFANNFSEFMLPFLKKFNADVLQIGGSITKSKNLFLPVVLENWNEIGFNIPITIINNTEEANIIGSSYLFNQSFWKNIKNQLPEF